VRFEREVGSAGEADYYIYIEGNRCVEGGIDARH
jgi:hypothetical protein